MRACIAAVLLAACAEPMTIPAVDAGATMPEACSEPFAVDAIELAIEEPPIVIEEGGMVPWVRGTQGAMMAVFRVAYASDAVPPCFRRSVLVESEGTPFFEAYPVTSTEPLGALHVEPALWIVEPPPGELVVTVETQGVKLTRAVVPTPVPSFEALLAPSSAPVGERCELALVLSHATPQRIALDVETSIDALVEAPDAIEYGATRATIVVTAMEAGALDVRVQGITASADPPPVITASLDAL